jgi:hypothetical protein
LPFRVACKLAEEWSSSSLPRQILLLCLITSRTQCYCCVQVFPKHRSFLVLFTKNRNPSARFVDGLMDS